MFRSPVVTHLGHSQVVVLTNVFGVVIHRISERMSTSIFKTITPNRCFDRFYHLLEIYIETDDVHKICRASLNQPSILYKEDTPESEKRFANFITVTFCLKLIAMHKKSFMPIFTKYSSDIDGDVNEARMVDIKC